jgi:sec-independent protein translocase protein TatA
VDVGVPELLIILVVILVVFGGAKIPQLARSLGQAHTEFKKGAAQGLGNDPAAAAPTAPAESPARSKPASAPPRPSNMGPPELN